MGASRSVREFGRHDGGLIESWGLVGLQWESGRVAYLKGDQRAKNSLVQVSGGRNSTAPELGQAAGLS